VIDALPYPEWKRLEDLYHLIRTGGFRPLEAKEIIEFGKLYRRATTELSFHRRHEADPERLAYLNDLVGRCYPFVYVAPRRPWPSVGRFFSTDFPCTLRRNLLWVLLATLITLIPATIGYVLTLNDRTFAAQVLPKDLVYDQTQIERHHTSTDWLKEGDRPSTSSFIMANNIKVSILAFSGGMTAGIVTLLILLQNGLMLGVIGAVVQLDGGNTALNFWAFVAPHGVLELPAIFIAGGAGLILAYAIINPKGVPRAVALRAAGREAITLMLGVAAMLVVAGTIEGFFSPIPPNQMPPSIKYLFAGVVAFLFVSYIALAGRFNTERKVGP
jgi:uncharacterized membrane protein SpoIIM required for sporulation